MYFLTYAGSFFFYRFIASVLFQGFIASGQMEAIKQGPQSDFDIIYSALSFFIKLCLGSIGSYNVLSEYKGAITKEL